jgi:hypothetical protein
MSAELTVISWRDIPAQVIARSGRVKVRSELPARFQTAIDRAAMNAGLFGSDTYLEEWRRDTRPCGDDLDAEVAAEVERILAAHPPERLNRLVDDNGQIEPPDREIP